VTAGRVIAAAPEVFIGSWCGKPVRPEKVRARPGWSDIPFVREDRLFEVKSTYILQPGPAALTDGVRQLHAILCRVAGVPPP
jgi:iron complex transport system substrate-binding protein